MAASPELPRAETLEELLDLEELDRDLYRAHNPRRPFTDHLYGGQVAAQALRAAGLTVPEGRHPHSMHCYYLRAGEAEHPTIMKVSRDRDGRSFSARRVEALQRGKAIFTACDVVPRRRGERRLVGRADAGGRVRRPRSSR